MNYDRVWIVPDGEGEWVMTPSRYVFDCSGCGRTLDTGTSDVVAASEEFERAAWSISWAQDEDDINYSDGHYCRDCRPNGCPPAKTRVRG